MHAGRERGIRARRRLVAAFQGLLLTAMAAGSVVIGAQPALADTFSDPGFSTEVVATVDPYTLVGLAFAPDGRLFVWQKNGVVRVIKNGVMLPTPFIDLSAKVNTFDDRGFWGFTFDPDFATNGYVYMTYVYEPTPDPNSSGARTSRLTRATADPANPDVALANSEIVILGSVGTAPCSAQPAGADCIPADGSSHSIGNIAFAPDGNLLLGNGDGDDASFADPLALRAQDLNSYSGKILRIHKDGTAVSDNPFYDGTNSVRSKVWLYGVRNPFRFSVQPVHGDIWFGDVGWNSWEEVNQGERGANYGWPCYEGTGAVSAYAGYTVCQNLPASSVTAPYHTYNHGVGSAAIGGPFYTGTAWPAQYRGNFFFADYTGNFIKRVTFDANYEPTGVQTFATNVAAPVSMTFGPDGMMYYLSFTTGEIRRIRTAGPSASISATPTSGYSPLTVSFSSAGSSDPGGGSLTYQWDFGDGGTSTLANPSHTYTSDTVATYAPTLTVKNSANLTSTATTSVTVGSLPPTPTISSPANGIVVQPGQTVNYSGSATDADDGTIPASGLSWTVLLHHNSHVHTFVGSTGASGSFVAENHGPVGTFSYEIILTATDSSGLKTNTSVTVQVGSDTTPPTTPANLVATALGFSQASLSWTASTDDSVVSNYQVERCQGAGCGNFAQVATPLNNAFTDSGLTASTTYSYRVRAIDPSNNVSAYSNVSTITTTADTRPPGLVAGWTFDAGTGGVAEDVTGHNNTGTITGAVWTAGKYGGGLSFNGVSDIVQVNSSSWLNLSTGMTLAAWIKPTGAQSGWRTVMQKQNDAYFLNASNETGALRPSGGGTFGGNSQWISGNTANPVDAWTHLALTYDGATMILYVNGVVAKSQAVTGTIQNTGNPLWLGGNSPYGEYFKGILDDAQVYNRALTATEIAAIRDNPLVPPVADNTPPSTPTSLASTVVNGNQINLTWINSTDNVGVAEYRVERCQDPGCANFAQIGTSGTNSFTDYGLPASTSFTYRVRAVDSSNNLSDYSNNTTSVTSTIADTTPPSAPSGLTATAVSPTQINLAWTASTDNIGVTGYHIERCQGASCTNWAEVGTSASTSFNNTGLTASTTYRFRVRANDAAGNLSGYSAIVSRATQANDTTPPSAPTGLAASVIGPTQINLSWTASTDNVGVTGYRVERCAGAGCTNYAQIGAPTGTSYNDTGLTPSTTYQYRVRATDAAGNLGNYSTVVNATTPAVPDTTPPSNPTGLTANPAGQMITLSWTASTDNVGVTGYRVERCLGQNCTTFAQIGTPTTTSYSDAGLAASTTYTYRVRAVDASNNLSGYSSPVWATTGADVRPPGLVAGWSFDAGSGTAAVDVSGNNNTGTITGATWVTGKYGNALSFNGSSNIVQVASSSSLNLSTGMTLAAWIMPTGTQSGWRTIMQRQPDAYFLNASNETGPLYPSGGATAGGNTQWISGSAASPVNAWTHVAITYDGSTLKLYVNGAVVRSQATTGAILSSTNPLWIGGNQPYGEYFLGVIDDAQIYNRALTAAEITTVMTTPLS
jgi:glucose/arabinose dehydrogenase/fibronectin type 3 domain-containing protein